MAGRDDAGRGGAGQEGTDQPGVSERSESEFDDAFAALVSGLDMPDLEEGADSENSEPAGGAGGGQPSPMEEVTVPKAVKIALVLTPIASADALASLCALSELACWVVPTSSGAVAVKELVSTHDEWDVSELLDGADSEPAEAAELAGTLSRLSRAGVVLVTADLATDVGIESGLSGTMTARHYAGGEAGEEVSAGLILASADQVIEDLLLGLARVQDVPGAIDTTTVKPSRIMKWFGRGLRGGGQD